jgi:hypothetical protein
VLEIEASANCFRFHRLHWECLELLDYWPRSIRPAAVNIRRLVSTTISRHPISHNRRVLIVSSRDPNRNSECIPHRQVSHPAIQTLHRAKKEFAVDIEAVVVRPGTFEALEDCLAHYKPGYFNLLHIDVHGSVEDGRYVFRLVLARLSFLMAYHLV